MVPRKVMEDLLEVSFVYLLKMKNKTPKKVFCTCDWRHSLKWYKTRFSCTLCISYFDSTFPGHISGSLNLFGFQFDHPTVIKDNGESRKIKVSQLFFF